MNKTKGLITTIIYVLITFILSDFVFSPLLDLLISHNNFSNSGLIYINALYNLILYVIVSIPIIIINYNFLKDEAKEFKAKKLIINCIAGYFIFYGVSIVGNILSLAIYADATSTNQNQIEALVTHDFLTFIIMAIAICILGPIVEELVFRKSIFNIISNKYLALAISSISFALIHLITSFNTLSDMSLFNGIRYFLAILIPYLFAGLCWGMLYLKNNRNIIFTIVLHILSNSISLFLIVISYYIY